MSKYSAKLMKQALENLGLNNAFTSMNMLAIALAEALDELDKPVEQKKKDSAGNDMTANDNLAANSHMGYRRLFIMRKDLQMTPGKLAAQVAHCAEAYWTNLLRNPDATNWFENQIICHSTIDGDVWRNYVNGTFTKTICSARNKNHLLKAKPLAEELGLMEGKDFGLIWDKCLTELAPEEEDGTTLIGIWFAPLPDKTAQAISRKYQLYR